jgi:hypothetical protein
MRDPDRGAAHIMINFTFYSISLGADIDFYSDGTWDIDVIYVLDHRGVVCEELPAHMLTLRADREIFDLVKTALENCEPEPNPPDDPLPLEYRIGNVNC